MAMSTSRITGTVIGESGLGEPDQDANSALTELDKGSINKHNYAYSTCTLSLSCYVQMQRFKLDKKTYVCVLFAGLRSGNVGEQCEAIVRFPRLFEKYPFPILINSSFLKLADVFRVG